MRRDAFGSAVRVWLVDSHLARSARWLVGGPAVPHAPAAVSAVKPVRRVNPSDGRVASSKVARINRRCDKLAYSSKKVAKATALAQSRFSGEHIEAYHCYACHAYHIGHPPKPYERRAS